MLSISIEYLQSIYEIKASTEQPDYDEALDNIESLITDICDVLSDTQSVGFRVSGFGELAWPVDVGTDLATIIPQIPDVLGALHQSENTSIQFYEQGIGRELFFSCNNSRVKMTCKYLTEDKPMPIKETADLSELRNMFGEFLASFIRLSNIICPAIAEHRIFRDWLKDVFCVTENTEVYETYTISRAEFDSAIFPEDDDESLSQKLSKLDELMESQPDLTVKPDSDLINLADELTQGNEN